MKQDNQTIVLMHLSQLVTTLLLGLGVSSFHCIIWMTKKDEIKDLDLHGKKILNFQFSILVYSFVCIPLMLIGVGFIGILVILVMSIVYPIKECDSSKRRTPACLSLQHYVFKIGVL